jgi:hypothetical protein
LKNITKTLCIYFDFGKHSGWTPLEDYVKLDVRYNAAWKDCEALNGIFMNALRKASMHIIIKKEKKLC